MLLFAFVALSFSQAVTIDLGAALEAFMAGSTPAVSTGFGPDGALGLYAADYASGVLTNVIPLSTVTGEAGANTGAPFTPSFVGWYNPSSSLVPAITVNDGAPATFGGVVTTPTPTNDLFMHAGAGFGTAYRNSVVYRWTAPQAGVVSFPTSSVGASPNYGVSFTEVDNKSPGAIVADVQIGGVTNPTPLAGTAGSSVSYTTIPDTAVSVGETVDFIVTYTTDFTYTGVNVHAVFSFTPTPSGTE
jgi:hypothetical protein